MNRHKVAAAIILLLGLAAAGIAWAHEMRHHDSGPHRFPHHGHLRSHSSVIIIGAPLAGSWEDRNWPPRYGYAYPPVVGYSAPPVYIERDVAPPGGTQPSTYWLYCDNPQGYHPTVSDCPAGWKPVPAQP
jgi:hypothetical protein